MAVEVPPGTATTLAEPISVEHLGFERTLAAPPPAHLSEQPELGSAGPATELDEHISVGNDAGQKMEDLSSLSMTFMLGNGQRRAMSFPSEDVTVGSVKQRLMEDWPPEWDDQKPVGVGNIRLLHLGKLLADNLTLKDCRIQQGNPNVVHLTVRPADLVPEEDVDAKVEQKKGSGCCVLM
ncbi:hypothetical protein YB2330_001167 [Saitoella coloradoensis]